MTMTMTMSIHGDRKVNPEDSEERDGARDSKRDENVGQCFKPKHQRQKTSQLINIFEERRRGGGKSKRRRQWRWRGDRGEEMERRRWREGDGGKEMERRRWREGDGAEEMSGGDERRR